jgi:hypothetical protein
MPRCRLTLAIFAAAAALTVIPACSTTKAPQQSTTTTVAPSTTSAPPQAHGVYEQCLTQHGVPSPAAGPAPGSRPGAAGPAPGARRGPVQRHTITAAARGGSDDLGQRAEGLRLCATNPADDGSLSQTPPEILCHFTRMISSSFDGLVSIRLVAAISRLQIEQDDNKLFA